MRLLLEDIVGEVARAAVRVPHVRRRRGRRAAAGAAGLISGIGNMRFVHRVPSTDVEQHVVIEPVAIAACARVEEAESDIEGLAYCRRA